MIVQWDRGARRQVSRFAGSGSVVWAWIGTAGASVVPDTGEIGRPPGKMLIGRYMADTMLIGRPPEQMAIGRTEDSGTTI